MRLCGRGSQSVELLFPPLPWQRVDRVVLQMFQFSWRTKRSMDFVACSLNSSCLVDIESGEDYVRLTSTIHNPYHPSRAWTPKCFVPGLLAGYDTIAF